MAEATHEWTSLQVKDAVATVSIDRPSSKNAFHPGVANELIDQLHRARRTDGVRVVVITGSGEYFSSGADLGWLQETFTAAPEARAADAEVNARLLRTIDELELPVVGRVNGSVFGGALGIVAACDISVAVTDAHFGFREVLLGLAPGVTVPYLLRAMGESALRHLFLTGASIPAAEAYAHGLVHVVCAKDELEQRVSDVVGALLRGSTSAHAAVKEIIREARPVEAPSLDATMSALTSALWDDAEVRSRVGSFLSK